MADAEGDRFRGLTSPMLTGGNLAVQELSRERVEIFGEITAAVTSTLELRFVLEILMEKVDQLLPYAAIMILLKRKSGGGLERVACRNMDEAEWRARELEAAPYFSRTVLETRRPLVVSDVQTDPRAVDPEFFRNHDLHSYLGIPLLANGKAIGVVSFLTKEAYAFSNDEIEFLTILTSQAAVAIHHSQLYEELQTRSDALASLYELTAAVNESLDLDPVLDKIIERIKDVFDFDATSIYLFNPESQLIERRAAWEASAGLLGSDAPVEMGDGLVGEVMETGQRVLFTDIREEPRFRPEIRTQAAISKDCGFVGLLPIKSQLRTVGVLAGAARERRELDDGELDLLGTIANQIGVAHEKSVLLNETRANANQLSAFKVDELERVNAELRWANRAKSDFVNAMSHELGTRLDTIMSHVEQLLDEPGGEVTNVQRRALETVRHHSRGLLRLSDNALNLSRADAGTTAAEAGPRPLDETVQHVRDYAEELNRETARDDTKICKCGHRESVHAFSVCAVQRCDCRRYEPKNKRF